VIRGSSPKSTQLWLHTSHPFQKFDENWSPAFLINLLTDRQADKERENIATANISGSNDKPTGY